MVQHVKVLAAQAGGPEFNSQNPHKEGRRKATRLPLPLTYRVMSKQNHLRVHFKGRLKFINKFAKTLCHCSSKFLSSQTSFLSSRKHMNIWNTGETRSRIKFIVFHFCTLQGWKILPISDQQMEKRTGTETHLTRGLNSTRMLTIMKVRTELRTPGQR